MRVLDADRIEAALGWSALIEALRAAFAAGTASASPRQVLEIEGAGGEAPHC